MNINGKVIKVAEINYLCVHKKLRSKRLAPVLIKEITRRVNLRDIWQATYTAGVVFPTPIGQARYWHRSLNPKKLIEIGFSSLPKRMTLAMTIKMNRLPAEPQLSGIRPMEARDRKQVLNLLKENLSHFTLHPQFTTADEIGHALLPRPGVVYTYVREKPKSSIITVLHHPPTATGPVILQAAYQNWTVATSVSLAELMNEALIVAKSLEFDVFNCLDIMNNKDFIDHCKFGPGNGYLQYYAFNWAAAAIPSEKIGLILL